MNLFIDTNIFLSFYHMTSDDLEELKKLAVLIDQRKLTLYLTEQVVFEFRRNRENKIGDALKRLKDQRLNLQFPQICKDYDEYHELRKLQKKYEEEHTALLSKINKGASEHSLKADQIIDSLFIKATNLVTKDLMIDRARYRIQIGNPPGKEGSLGDAINWEALLEHVPDNVDLYFIADDRDYYSILDESKFKEYLLLEWSKKKHSSIIFYRQLSAFFNEHFPDIKLASELEKELLIRNLSASHNFDQTHRVVAKLSKYTDFTHAQANAIIEAAVSNSQISWIIEDEDVNQFLRAVISGREDQIDPNNLGMLYDLLKKAEQGQKISDERNF